MQKTFSHTQTLAGGRYKGKGGPGYCQAEATGAGRKKRDIRPRKTDKETQGGRNDRQGKQEQTGISKQK